MFRWFEKGEYNFAFFVAVLLDVAMGFMVGVNSRGGRKVKCEHMIRRAELRDGIMVCRPLRTEYDERIIETSAVGVGNIN